MKIYIIAGEASGDIYGAKLIECLRSKSSAPIEFYGIGGDKMQAVGFVSLFDMSEISIMGFAEILPHLGNILNRIDQTVADIQEKQPDIVITIDSPGFCCTIAKRLRFGEDNLEKILKKIFCKKDNNPLPQPSPKGRGSDYPPYKGKLLHYVAPTVWAYKPKRAEKFAKLFDHLMVILPFEPPYFDAVGLPCTYVGHPIVETNFPKNGDEFKQKHNITDDETLICLMPGSRKSEVKRLLPTFLETVDLLTVPKKIRVVIPTIPALKSEIEHMIATSKIKAIITDNEADKLAAYKASSATIVKSGTGSLEVALAGCPMVIAYKVNYISYRIVKHLVKIKYANLINLMLDEELIPEFLQAYCTSFLIAQKLDKIIADIAIQELQILHSLEVLKTLGLGDEQRPSQKAADRVLILIG
jgi:lipid-A-disaccharide synthase